jgi:ribosomal peptide maturation radical SAM protein 1
LFRIAFITMPFANLHIPSLGLSQLQSVVSQEYGADVSIEIRYLNHDFAQYLGLDLYKQIIAFPEHQNSGIGDWFFRQVAFPELADNADEYYSRYYAFRNDTAAEVRRTIEQKRQMLNQFMDHLIDTYHLDQFDLVGFTSMFVQNVACIAMARKLKERNPAIVTVMGGANCEAPMGIEIAREIDSVDFIFSGPALKSFPEFIGYYLNGELGKCHHIDGVISKQNIFQLAQQSNTLPLFESSAEATPIALLGQELDVNTLIELEYDTFLSDLAQNFPHGEIHPVLLFETSRGCWWGERSHCTFCGLNGLTMNYRAMESSLAFDFMRTLFERYADRCRNYICVDNIMPRSYLSEVFPRLSPPEGTVIFYEVKSSLSAEDIAILSRAGVRILQPGIESLATSTLKLMGKGASAFQNISFLKNCTVYNVYPTWNLLIGFPGEDPQVYEKYVRDIPLLLHLPPPTGVYPVRFDRYSPYFNKAEEYGLDLHPLDYYSLIYPFAKESLNRMSYYFMDANFDADYFQNVIRWIGKVREQVDRWQMLWNVGQSNHQPMLYFKHDTQPMRIYDSRHGQPVEYAISELSQRILVYLTRPRKPSDLASMFSDLTAGELEAELALLHKRQLLFEEDDRLMSIVLDQAPAKGDFRSSPIVSFNFDVDVNDTLASSKRPASKEPTVLTIPSIKRASRDAHRIARSRIPAVSQTPKAEEG